ncbi:TonB-dependent receptor [Pseudotenacibaculum sp. MALMAid0570]|uniref:TonB-dependent receptor n=1 Tax=Pseudotenacibaculum sp. MALMAid0570 TaxID=3143938 RepID=UPI0032DF96B9
MKKIIFLFVSLFYITSFYSQTTVSGKVTDHKGEAIFGANVYLDGTYDGASTNEKGEFSFTSEEKGTQTLVVSFVSFEEYTLTADISTFKKLTIKLREDVNTLDAVIINAGTFEAGDNAKVTALKPLDVVTTASALGDFVGALQTLPGTSTVAEDGRLFVRGGDAEETQIFIDGIRVFTPFTPSSNNIPTRGRFSPFLFKGISFSTGGYSAEYGQALSSVLLLNTIDEPDQEKTDIAAMTVGIGVGNTQKWEKGSFSINTSYINLAPYLEAFPDRNTWNKPIQSANGEMVYRYKLPNDGLIKLYGAFSYTDFDLIQQDINFTNGFRFGLENRNLYFNGSYKGIYNNGWTLATGFSFANDNTNLKIVDDLVNDNENSAHMKIKARKRFSNRFKLNFGAEYFITDFKENFQSMTFGDFDYGFQNNIFGTFAEADIFFSKKLASKVGIRLEHSELLNQTTVSPRASIAYKFGEYSQFSLAYGQFYQNPKSEYLKFSNDFVAENTSHLIANFQYVKEKQIFRIEAYYKDYKDLVKFDTQFVDPSSNFSNDGGGFAKGIDVFWRDNQSIKNTDYWISYSFLDTEREYQNYPVAARPNFASAHNLSVISKHWVEKWKSQFGFSYNFASGRNYTDPNQSGFLNRETKSYNSISLNWAYLIDQQKILYFSVNNVLGTKNVFGYNYANQPNINGTFAREAIVPNADQFFFVGFFWTLSDDNKSNQLDNL